MISTPAASFVFGNYFTEMKAIASNSLQKIDKNQILLVYKGTPIRKHHERVYCKEKNHHKG